MSNPSGHTMTVCEDHGTVYRQCRCYSPNKVKLPVPCQCAGASTAVEELVGIVHLFKAEEHISLVNYKRMVELSKTIASGDESDTDWRAVLQLALDGVLS